VAEQQSAKARAKENLERSYGQKRRAEDTIDNIIATATVKSMEMMKKKTTQTFSIGMQAVLLYLMLMRV
jgi:hypothetical protein